MSLPVPPDGLLGVGLSLSTDGRVKLAFTLVFELVSVVSANTPVDPKTIGATKENAVINSSQQVIMTGNQGNVFSGTYDMDLGTVSLEIPDASRISQGQSTGSITWNLAQTPQNP
ncbi:hypothetical protein BH736_13070 [Enterococcus hirae]|nr:hypothetical protein BH736_13070 [Enterococcus hirae]